MPKYPAKTKTIVRDSFALTPPQNLELEQCLLGAMLLYRASIFSAVDLIEQSAGENVFYLDKHKLIYTKLKHYVKDLEGDPDIAIFTDRFGAEEIDKIGGSVYLATLVQIVPNPRDAKTYAEAVIATYRKRRRFYLANDLQAMWVQENELGSDEFDFLAESEKLLRDDLILRDRRDKSAKDLCMEVFDEWQLRCSTGGIMGLKSGFPYLDQLTGGWVDGSLIIVGGRPAMGKTSLVLQFLDAVAMKGKKVCFVSLEMSDADLMARVICQKANFSSSVVRYDPSQLNDAVWERVTTAMGHLKRNEWIVKDRPGATLQEIIAAIENAAIEENISIAAVDYLQLIGGFKPEHLTKEVSEACAQFKALARRLKIPIILISQLSRAVDSRTKDKRPTMSDLRDSGGIEQAADAVLLCYRHSYYEKDMSDDPKGLRDMAELILDKNRFGPTGSCWAFFDGPSTSFHEDIDRTVAILQKIEALLTKPKYPKLEEGDVDRLMHYQNMEEKRAQKERDAKAAKRLKEGLDVDPVDVAETLHEKEFPDDIYASDDFDGDLSDGVL